MSHSTLSPYILFCLGTWTTKYRKLSLKLDLPIGAKWRSGSTTVGSANPYREKVWSEIPETTFRDVDDPVTVAREAVDIGPQPRMSVEGRSGYPRRLAELIEGRLQQSAPEPVPFLSAG
jgi:hypothetical protein